MAELHDGARLPAAETGVPLLRLGNLRACELDFSALRHVDPHESVSWPQVRTGDVLFTSSAVPFRAAVVPEGAPETMTVSPEIVVMRPHAAIIPEYLAALLSTEAYRTVLQDLAYRRTPSALQRLRLHDIRRLPVPLPRRSLQEEIKEAYGRAARLSDEAREEIWRVVRAVHAEVDARLKLREVSRDCFAVSRSSLGARWDVSHAKGRLLREVIARNDVMVRLPELARPVTCSLRGIDQDNAVLAVQADDINETSFLVEGARPRRLTELSSRVRQRLAIGDVLVCTTGRGGQVAYLDAALAEGELPVLGSATFTALRFSETPRFFAVALAHPVVRLQLDHLASGTVQRFINKRDLDDLLVPSLGGVWREDFEARIDRAMQRRREALAARSDVLAAAETFVNEGWQT